jgi:hypothetical protein
VTLVTTQGRTAARLARMLRVVAGGREAWVSTQARVRLASGEIWAPDVVVGTGEPPHDGVMNGLPALIVETTPEAFARWEVVGGVTVWGVFDGAVRISRDGRTRRIAPHRIATVPRRTWLRVPVTDLLGAAAD